MLTYFANRIRDIAASSTDRYRDSNKVYISGVYQAYCERFGSVARDLFDKMIFDANQADLIVACRADLITDMDKTKVANSEVNLNGHALHFIRV